MDTRELQRALMGKLGASEARQSHHIYYFLNVNGADHRVAKLSHSSRGQLHRFIVSDTAKRLRLSGPQLAALVDCSLGKAQFFESWDSKAETSSTPP